MKLIYIVIVYEANKHLEQQKRVAEEIHADEQERGLDDVREK